MEISFVSLKCGSLLVGKGPKTYLKEAHSTLPSWYSPDFFLTETHPWHTHETFEIVPKLSFPLTQSHYSDIDSFKEMYQDMNLRKGVVYTSALIHNFNWQSVATHLTEKGGQNYLYGTKGVMGATPELLFDLEQDSVSTMALAGTALNPEDLLQHKEIEEHEIVVNAIYESLAPFGQVGLGNREPLSYGKLFHSLTAIKLHATPSFDVLVKALHPTPALGTYPIIEGKSWLKKWGERVPRYKFGAPFGYVFPERGESRAFVAIRCVQWDEHEARLWAGVGVTKKSLFDKEWEEVVQKFRNTSYLLGIHELTACQNRSSRNC